MAVNKSVVAFVDFVSGHSFLVDLSLDEGLLKVLGLLFIISKEIFLGKIDSLRHTVLKPVDDFHGSKFVLDNVSLGGSL